LEALGGFVVRFGGGGGGIWMPFRWFEGRCGGAYFVHDGLAGLGREEHGLLTNFQTSASIASEFFFALFQCWAGLRPWWVQCGSGGDQRTTLWLVAWELV
jgi:hypothetical protein